MNEVYVIAGGEWLRNNLNAIAAFMGTWTWDSIEKIALTLSVLAVAVMWVQRHNVMDLLGWVAVFVLISLLVNVRTSVQIIDNSDLVKVHRVDNVPVGLAMPLSLTTRIPDNSVQPGAGNGEPVTAEVLAQRQAEEAIRRETERRADEIVRKMAENKPDLPDGKTEQAVREIAGQERDRAAITEREAALPEGVLREPQRVREAVREIARENLLQERLQQMERDMVRDLQKEKTLGGD
ncbi:hypothetical protein F3K31_24930 (plasmid) [Escherichia coli]|nr:hypothetical protein F3K31_24930 [Escherichia coli]